MNTTSFTVFPIPWGDMGFLTWWSELVYGDALSRVQRRIAAEATSAALDKKMKFQARVAGCRRTRTERWNNAHFMRWQEYHAAAFEVVYGKMSDDITVHEARVFTSNFLEVEHRLAKRHHRLMSGWGKPHRKMLCDLLKANSQWFARVRRFDRLSRVRRHILINEINAVLEPHFVSASEDV